MIERLPQVFDALSHFAVDLADEDLASGAEQNVARAVIVGPEIDECAYRGWTADDLGKVSSLIPFCTETT